MHRCSGPSYLHDGGVTHCRLARLLDRTIVPRERARHRTTATTCTSRTMPSRVELSVSLNMQNESGSMFYAQYIIYSIVDSCTIWYHIVECVNKSLGELSDPVGIVCSVIVWRSILFGSMTHGVVGHHKFGRSFTCEQTRLHTRSMATCSTY